MIRITCPHCQLSQDFDDTCAGTDASCRWCDEPFNVGGPDAEFVPDASPQEPQSFAASTGRLCAALCMGIAGLLGLVALVGLPVLDFGFGCRFAEMRPTEFFWPTLLAAGGFGWLADRFSGDPPAVSGG